MSKTRRELAGLASGIAMIACLACSGGGAAGSAPAGVDASIEGGLPRGVEDGGDAAGEDGGADDGGVLETWLDGGPTFVSGSTSLDDGSAECAGSAVGGARPVSVRTPAGYDCSASSWPLVILLHDYGSSGDAAEAYFQLAAQADALGFLYAHPDGTKDAQGNEFWNATDACCNAGGSTVDDSAWLDTLIREIHVQYNSDPSRVFVFGYGNGGFMAYRLACDHAADVAAVADLGGATWEDPSRCPLGGPVSALEIHGTADATFAYDGGTNLGAAYPSAPATIAEWATFESCRDGGAPGAGLDLLIDDAGTDTTVTEWPRCAWGAAMQLWTIQGGTHQPTLSTTFAPTMLAFLLAHPRP